MEVTESYETSVTTHQMPTVARDSNKNFTLQYNPNNGKGFGFFLIYSDMVKMEQHLVGILSYAAAKNRHLEKKYSSGVQEIPYISRNPKPHYQAHKNTLFQAK